MKVIDFVQTKCVLPARAGKLYKKKYELLPWQKKYLENMFNDDGSVKIPNAYLIGSRKTAKTDFAMLCLAYRFFNKNRHGELHTISAFSESQAMLLYEYFVELISLVPEFKKQARVYHNRVLNRKNSNLLKVLTKSQRSSYGLFCNGINIFDEVGVYDDECFNRMEILRKGGSLAEEPQTIFLANVPEYEDHKSVELLRNCEKSKYWQVKKFVADKQYSWNDERAWASANPFYSYKKTPGVQNFYKQQYQEAKGSAKAESEFKRLLLGWGVQLSNSRWIQPENLTWSNREDTERILQDRDINWSLGFDLSLQGADSTSWSLVGLRNMPEDSDPLEDENQKVYVYSNIYYGNIDSKRQSLREKIIGWDKQGYVKYQKSKVVNQTKILDDVYQFLENRWFSDDITFTFDPAYSHSWVQACQDDFRTSLVTYSPKFMTRPIRIMQRKAEQKNIVMLQEKNPAIIWQCGNGIVNERSRNWCLLARLHKNPQLNIDCWSSSLLGLTSVLKTKPKQEVLVL